MAFRRLLRRVLTDGMEEHEDDHDQLHTRADDYPNVVADYGVTPGEADSSDRVQEAIHDQSVAGGGYVDLPGYGSTAPYNFNVDIETGVVLRGVGDRGTVIRSVVSNNAPILGTNVTTGPTNYGAKNLQIWGRRQSGGTERGIECTIHGVVPGAPKSFRFEDILIFDTGGHGMFVGPFVQSGKARGIETFWCGDAGLWFASISLDNMIEHCSIGASFGLYNIVCNGGGMSFSHVKSWFNQHQTSGVYDGFGWQIAGSVVTLAGCISEDNPVGLLCPGQIVARDFESRGDEVAAWFYGFTPIQGGRGSDVHITQCSNDRYIPKVGIRLGDNLQGGVYEINPLKYLVDTPAYRAGGSPDVPITYLPSGTLNLDANYKAFEEDISGPSQHPDINRRNSFSIPTKGKLTWIQSAVTDPLVPDYLDSREFQVTLNANLTVNAGVHWNSVAPGDEIVFWFRQDATGGRTVTWDGVQYQGLPQPNPAPNSLSIMRLRNQNFGAAFVPYFQRGACILGDDVWHTVGAASQPAFQNSWVDFAGAFRATSFRRTTNGDIELAGIIKSGTIGQVAFTLPLGYRPSAETLFVVMSNGAIGRVDVFANGDVKPVQGSAVYVSLDGITFKG